MMKQEQINTLIDRLEKLESKYTRLHEEQRRDVLDNLERYGKTIRLLDKHNGDIDRLNTIVERLDEFEKCRKCPAWSGTDCTRNPYTEGCLDDKVNLKNEIKRLEKENEQLKAKLEARLTCNFVKTAQIHAVQEFAEKLKKYSYTDNCFTDGKWHRYVLVSDIDELLKEYKE